MNSLKKGLIFSSLIAFSTAVSAATPNTSSSYPSFGFVQEMAGVTANGDISADFYNNTGYPTHLRIGAFKGEIMIDPSSTAASATGMGYKFPINRHFGIYGKLYLNSGGTTSTTNITLGGSYTGNSGNFLYNGNAEAFSTSAGTNFNIKGAGFYKLNTNKLGGSMSVGAEVNLRLSPSPTQTNLYAGLRWQPKSKLIVDAGLASSTAGTTTLGTPAFVRLTLGL